MPTFAPTEASEGRTSRFLWTWLILAASASDAGNVTHAILSAPEGTAALAAAASVVPPVVLLGSTHSVALLVRARQTNRIYWCALLTTMCLAGCAFALSFDALSGLAEMAGMRSGRAWLWPCAIDLSIAQSTLALLAMTGAPRHRPPPLSMAKDVGEPAAVKTGMHPGAAIDGSPNPIAARDPSVDATGPTRWHSAARQLVDAGVTLKDVDVVARVLAEHEAGTAPSTIGRRLDVHHSTVGRILTRAAELS